MNNEDRIDELMEEYLPSELAEMVIELENGVDFLRCLEAAGVDNWEGYDVAYQLYKGEIDEDDI